MPSHPKLPAEDDAEQVGTPAYRARHISMLWSAQLWHEVVMVAACVFMLGLTFYAIAPKLAKLVP